MKTFEPFSNGTEAMVWQENNCDRCYNRRTCSARKQIDDGFIVGHISDHAANLIGNDGKKLFWDCRYRNKILPIARRGPRQKPGQTSLF